MSKVTFEQHGDLGEVVMASEDLQSGAHTLLAEGPGKAKFAGR